MIRQIRLFTMTVAAGLALTACLPKAANYTGAEAIKRNEVTIIRTEYPVDFEAEGRFSDVEKQALSRFIARSQLREGDVLTLESGSAVSGSAKTALAEHLARHGLYLDDAPVVASVAPDANQAILMVDRYVVVPQDCPGTAETPRHNYANAASADFGCTNVQALGQMVANPRDLVEGASGRNPTAEAATKGIRKYRVIEPVFLPPAALQRADMGGGGS